MVSPEFRSGNKQGCGWETVNLMLTAEVPVILLLFLAAVGGFVSGLLIAVLIKKDEKRIDGKTIMMNHDYGWMAGGIGIWTVISAVVLVLVIVLIIKLTKK